MADNLLIPISGGTATTATDDVASVHYQRVKNVWGADGVATDVSAVSPMPVTLGQSQLWFEVNVPGVDTAIYASGDQFGTLITISNAARATGKGGWINGICYHDDDDVMGALDVLFFNDTPTLAANNAAFAINDADARKLIYVANLTYLNDLGANRYGQLQGISIPYFCTGTSLYVALIVRSTPTLPGTTGQRIRIGLTLD